MADETKPAGAEETDNRRQFFLKLGLGSLGIAVAGTAAFAYQFLDPNVLYEPSPVVNAGKPDRYPLDSVTLDVDSGIYIIHSQEGYFSLSAVCTHLGLSLIHILPCAVPWARSPWNRTTLFPPNRPG